MLSSFGSAWFAIFAGISLKSAAILAIACLLAFLLRGRSSAARHLVWTAAAAAVLALPFLSTSLPELRLSVPSRFAIENVGLVFRVAATAGPDAANAAAAGIPASSLAPRSPSAPLDWRLWLLFVWALGLAAVIGQMAVAYARLRRIRRRAAAFPNSDLAGSLALSLGIEQPVEILEAAPGTMPMTFGLRRPVILLPADASEWSAERLRLVLLHELAHVRRGDAATHLMARAALGLNWWNPLAWTAWRSFLKEGERAADDLVLQAGARASEYASHLLEVARSLQSVSATASAAVAMARPSQLEGRLLAILDSRLNRSAARLAPWAAALAAVILVAPFAAVKAQDNTAQPLPEVDATIRAANAQKNHEILEHAASAFENLRQFDVAKKLLDSALEIRGQVSGEQSAAYAAGLVKLGDLELKRRNEAEAQAFYTKAVSLGDTPEVASALVYLGMRNMHRNPEAARDFFQRAIKAAPASPSAGQAYTWLAEMRRIEADGAVEAESLYQKALSIEGPDSTEAANTLFLYARFLREQNRETEAAQHEARAKEIAKANSVEVVKALQSAVSFKVSSAPSDSTRAGSAPRTVTDPNVAGVTMPTPSAGVYRVGGGVSAPTLLRKLEPEYSETARAAKYQGTVLLYIEVDPNGRATNIRVVRSLGLGLDEKAIEAVQQWQFKPGMKDGVPVTVAATIEINFRLQ